MRVKVILLIFLSFLFSTCCPKINKNDYLFYKQPNRNLLDSNLYYNKLYYSIDTVNLDNQNETLLFDHLVFYENGIYEYSILNYRLKDVLSKNIVRRHGFYKINGNNIYLESYGNCGSGMYFEKINIINSDTLILLGSTSQNVIDYTFNLEPSFNRLNGSKKVYQLYKDSNNNSLEYILDTNHLKFGD